jgi:hypothetical protein
VPGIDPTEARTEGLRAAAVITAGRRKGACCCAGAADPVIELAGRLSDWLLSRPASIRVGDPVISAQGNPALHGPATRTGADMAVTIKDSQIATYPAPEALDSKGFEVTDAITVTTDDTAGALVTQVNNDDGTVSFTAVAPGAVQITWSDGAISFVDTLNVTTGDAAQIVVGAPAVTDQA